MEAVQPPRFIPVLWAHVPALIFAAPTRPLPFPCNEQPVLSSVLASLQSPLFCDSVLRCGDTTTGDDKGGNGASNRRPKGAACAEQDEKKQRPARRGKDRTHRSGRIARGDATLCNGSHGEVQRGGGKKCHQGRRQALRRAHACTHTRAPTPFDPLRRFVGPARARRRWKKKGRLPRPAPRPVVRCEKERGEGKKREKGSDCSTTGGAALASCVLPAIVPRCPVFPRSR